MRDKPLILNDTAGADLANTLMLRSVYRKPKAKPAPSRISRPQEQAQTAEPATAQQETQPHASEQRETVMPVYGRYVPARQAGTDPATSPESILSQPTFSEPEAKEERLSFAQETLEEDEVPGTGPAFVVLDAVEEEAEKKSPRNHDASESIPPVTGSKASKNTHQSIKANPRTTVREANLNLGKSIAPRGISNRAVRHHRIPQDHLIHSDTSRSGRSFTTRAWWKALLMPWRQLSIRQLNELGLSKAEVTVLHGLYRGYDVEAIANRSDLDSLDVLSTRRRLLNMFRVSTDEELLEKVQSMYRSFRAYDKHSDADLRKGEQPGIVPLAVGTSSQATGTRRPIPGRTAVKLEELRALGLEPNEVTVAHAMFTGLNRSDISRATGLPEEDVRRAQLTLMVRFHVRNPKQLLTRILMTVGRGNRRTSSGAKSGKIRVSYRPKAAYPAHSTPHVSKKDDDKGK